MRKKRHDKPTKVAQPLIGPLRMAGTMILKKSMRWEFEAALRPRMCFTWVVSTKMAAAEVKPTTTGLDIKAERNPTLRRPNPRNMIPIKKLMDVAIRAGEADEEIAFPTMRDITETGPTDMEREGPRST
jgi:hypothetical protein